MDEFTRKRLEYEDQIFLFSSHLLAENFKNFVKNELECSVDTLINSYRKKLISESKNPEDFEKKIEEMKIRLKSEYVKSLECEYQDIREHIQKAMNIPEHILLREDLPIRIGLTTDLGEIEKEINTLKGRFKAMCYLKQKMDEEIEIADSAIFILDSIIDKKKIDFRLLNSNEVNEVLLLTKSNLSLLQ